MLIGVAVLLLWLCLNLGLLLRRRALQALATRGWHSDVVLYWQRGDTSPLAVEGGTLELLDCFCEILARPSPPRSAVFSGLSFDPAPKGGSYQERTPLCDCEVQVSS